MDLIEKVEEIQSQLSLFATRSNNSPKYRADLVELQRRGQNCYFYTIFHLQDADSVFRIHHIPKGFATLDQGKSIGIMS